MVLLLDNILGSAIKELRKSKKMTQQELSKLTGLKQNTISNHENGKRQLDEIDIRTYAKALRVSPQTLFNLSKQNSDNILHDIKENKTQIQSIYDKLSDRNKPKLIKYGNELLEGQSEAKERVVDIEEYRERVSLPAPGKVSAGTGYWQGNIWVLYRKKRAKNRRKNNYFKHFSFLRFLVFFKVFGQILDKKTPEKNRV